MPEDLSQMDPLVRDRSNWEPVRDLIEEGKVYAAEKLFKKMKNNPQLRPQTQWGFKVFDSCREYIQARNAFVRDIQKAIKNGDMETAEALFDEVQEFCTDDPRLYDLYEQYKAVVNNPSFQYQTHPTQKFLLPAVNAQEPFTAPWRWGFGIATAAFGALAYTNLNNPGLIDMSRIVVGLLVAATIHWYYLKRREEEGKIGIIGMIVIAVILFFARSLFLSPTLSILIWIMCLATLIMYRWRLHYMTTIRPMRLVNNLLRTTENYLPATSKSAAGLWYVQAITERGTQTGGLFTRIAPDKFSGDRRMKLLGWVPNDGGLIVVSDTQQTKGGVNGETLRNALKAAKRRNSQSELLNIINF